MSLKARKILLVEDDELMREIVCWALRAEGYEVQESADGVDALALVATSRPDLIILDVKLPKMDGWEVLASLRRDGRRELVLMLTGSADVNSRVRGLEAGADDYLGKPCAAEELRARVKALFRRLPDETTASRRLRFGDIIVDLERKAAECEGRPVRLARMEFALLDLFAENLDKPVSRKMLLEKVWGVTTPLATRTVDTHMWRLRHKLGDTGESGARMIRNLPGIGYVMSSAVRA